jgi:predicted TIM-barrel fold metal-dependent hydrolase
VGVGGIGKRFEGQMINDVFVINPVTHAYNLTQDNMQNSYGEAVRELLIALHQTWQPDGVSVTAEEFSTDWSVDTMARTLFLETDIDIAATHTLRLDSYFKDGLCSRAKTVEALTKYPDRFVGYVGVDPTAGVDTCLRDMDEQLDELPQAVGLKLYPAQVAPDRHWRMDDPAVAFPLFAHAQERGIKTVAIHKAAPLGPVPMNPYRVDDVDGAAGAFPDLSFEIIHAGLSFVDETAWAIARYPNLYANLEVTSSLVIKAPKLFEQVMAQFLLYGGPQKIIFSDGCMFAHSQPIIEGIMNFQFSDETCEGMGLAKLTKEDKALILGGNYARIVGLDIEAAGAKIADDEFARERRESGLQAPYSNWRTELAARSPEAVGSAR